MLTDRAIITVTMAAASTGIVILVALLLVAGSSKPEDRPGLRIDAIKSE